MTMAGGIQIGRRDTGAASIVVAGSTVTSPIQGHVNYTAPGSADEVTIATAIADLTPNRDWTETVLIIGKFFTADQIVLPKYTRLVTTSATVLLNTTSSKKMLVNENQTDNGGDSDIEVIGGIWTSNYTGTDGLSLKDAISLIEVDGWKVEGVEVTLAPGNGVFIRGVIAGGSGSTKPGYMRDVYAHANGETGVVIQNSAREDILEGIRCVGNKKDGFVIQASECTGANFFLKGNGRYNFGTVNVHSCNFRGVTSIDGGLHGIHLDGFVDSYIQGISHGSCKGTHAAAFTSGGTTSFKSGDKLTGNSSTETMIVADVVLTSGSFANGDAAGTVYVTSKSGTFTNGETLNRGADTNLATLTADPVDTTNTFDDLFLKDQNTKSYGDNRNFMLDVICGPSIRERDKGSTPDARYAANFSDGCVENIGGFLQAATAQTGAVNWPPESQRVLFTSGGMDLNTGLQWTASGSGTNEFFLEASGGGTSNLTRPRDIYDDGSKLSKGTSENLTLGSLLVGEWGFGDNDSNGFSSIYARLSDGTDPDSSTMTASPDFGVTVTGATSSATGVITSIYEDAGTWPVGDVNGVIWVKSVVGVFTVGGENLNIPGHTNVMTAGSGGTITKLGVIHARRDDSVDLRAAKRHIVSIKILDESTALTTGDGKFIWFVPVDLTGMNLVAISAGASTASTSGIPTFQIRNVTDSADMLTTKLTIDQDEKHSSTAATAVLVNTDNDDVVTGDELAIDVDVAGTGCKGVVIDLVFQLPT